MFCSRCGKEFVQNVTTFCSQCGVHVSINKDGLKTEKEIITEYFLLGLKYSTIVQFLSKYYDIEISVRTLKRRLFTYGLKKKGDVNLELLNSYIKNELKGPASFYGYRKMQKHLQAKYKISVSRDTIMFLLKELDPEGTERRKSRKLIRRRYGSPGPDHCWHADGYDKLKPYGLPIHGAIDGFSRKIIWLKVTKTNNDPIIIGSLYLNAIKEGKIAPSLLRTDCGTENGLMAAIQCFLHQNEKAHLFSRSVSNQRIENWWSHMRRGFSGWIINFFKDLVAEGSLLPGDHLHKQCVWFVFSGFLQQQLDEVMRQWNSHYIRSQPRIISGVPNEMYYLPENFGFLKCGIEIDNHDINTVLEQRDVFTDANNAIMTDEDLEKYFRYVVMCEKLSFPPNTWDEARQVFKTIIEKVA